MELGIFDISGATDIADDVALFDAVVFIDRGAAQMGIGGRFVAAMLDDDHIAIAAEFVADIDDFAVGSRPDGFAVRGGDVDAVIGLAFTFGAEGGDDFFAVDGPHEAAAVGGGGLLGDGGVGAAGFTDDGI